FFDKESETVAKYCLCQKNFSRIGRGTTCLRNHLKSKHPAEFQTLNKTDLTYKAKTEMSGSRLSRSHLGLQVGTAFPNADPLGGFNAIDKSLVQMLIKDLSFNMIEGVGFSDLMKVLRPRYALRPINYYVNIICQDVYQRMHSHLMQQLSTLDSLTLVTSLYSDSGQGLLTLSGYGISSDFQARLFRLKCEPMDEEFMTDVSSNVCKIIDNTVIELQLPKDKINFIIKNEGTCVPDSRIVCSTSLLKMCVKSTLDANEQLQQLDAKCMQIVKYFQQSTIAYNHLKCIHEDLLNRAEIPPIFDGEKCSPKWNSIFLLKASLLQVEDALTIYAEENNNDMIKIYPDEWENIELCNRVIQPIEEVIEIWSKSTASSVIPLVAAVKDSLRNDIHNYASSMASYFNNNLYILTICSFAGKLLEELENKCIPLTRDIKYLMATYLDPRYKQAFFNQEEVQLVTDEMLTQLSRIQNHGRQHPATSNVNSSNVNADVKTDSKIDSFLDNMLALGNNNLEAQYQFKNLLFLYNSEARLDRQSDPIIWWQSNPKYALLFPIVRKYITIPAACDYSEQLFSESTNFLSDWLSWDMDLSHENVCKILFTKANFGILDHE
ncbi:hypothetical protein KR215_000692, partial [Drosophila sulfurigaster]